MLRNYIRMAIRQLKKQKMFTAIKIGGFALSIAACLLIGLYIRDEISYDKHHAGAENIYRVIGVFKNDDGKVSRGVAMPPPGARTLKNDFPEVALAGRLMPYKLFGGAGSNQIRRADQKQSFYEEGFSFADQELIDILELPMVYGNRETALKDPNTLLISKRKADIYFPGENPTGKILYFNGRDNFPIKIGGVMADPSPHSHLQFDFYISLAGVSFWDNEQEGWGSSNYDTYLKLRPGTERKALQKKMTSALLKNYMIPEMKKAGDVNADEILKKASLELQPIGDVHLKSYNIDDSFTHGDQRFVWLFAIVAALILVIACINFVNLATAKSANRAKEVGLRKVVGSSKGSLITQFLTESLLYSLISFLLAVAFAIILLPWFNQMAAKSLAIPWKEWWLLPSLLAAALFTGLISGVYPSFYLSAFKPVSVLKGNISKASRNVFLRNGLVVFQFTTSIILIIGTIVIYKQTNFLLNRNVGFDRDQVVVIQSTQTLGQQLPAFRDELKNLREVKAVTVSDFLPVSGTKRNGNTFWKEGRRTMDDGVGVQVWDVDDNYISALGMKIVAGRNFSPTIASDSMALIINQTMAKKMGLTDPIGQKIMNWETYTIIGVVEDFNFESMKHDMGGLCFRLRNSPTMISAKINPANMKEGLASIETLWKKFLPYQQIRYNFLDDSFANMYASVKRMQNIFLNFSILAIIIACLGLFALSAFIAEQRNKEIGIRKVLGASVSGITTMLSKDFVKLVAISVVIAVPLGWWAMNKWMEDFSYRTPITWWIFALAALLALLIAVFTISFQSIKAALQNPTKSLRSE
ncbi:ABC transporter permease [Pollutibacter soli]|uniref:ABC transporter permease n=1 Tax=Pollutibacter soli TaxID=3034157 RepID=UPI0030137E15